MCEEKPRMKCLHFRLVLASHMGRTRCEAPLSDHMSKPRSGCECGVLIRAAAPHEQAAKRLRMQGAQYTIQTIFSGWNTSSNRSSVRNPSLTQASLREIFSRKAFFAVFAAFSYPM